MDKSTEKVLVLPTARFHVLGVFQGFCPRVADYLPALLDPAHLQYLARGFAETDPSFKQLIPYIVLRWRDRIFCYTRGNAGGEARLRSLRSLGIGGHICAEDGASSTDPYRAGLLRELEEEVYLDTTYNERTIGLINDDRTSVGQVHLGIVHVFDLAEPKVRHRDPALADGAFAPLEQLILQRREFETWSQFLLEGDWLKG
ncbi:MAG TPA: phosphoesterase [Gemmataceae bacterium]|jgi:predicted NUDIX family phosphoesterase